MEFQSTPLFGGAIYVDLPVGWQDVSTIRQIPDNQEVYLDSQGYSSIVFDILERVSDQGTDLEALKYHLSDILETDPSSSGIEVLEEGAEVQMGNLPDVKAYTTSVLAPPGEKQRGRAHEPEEVGVLILLVRLERVGTDLVVCVNVPCGFDGQGDREEVLELGKSVRERVRVSLEVREWGLFGGGE